MRGKKPEQNGGSKRQRFTLRQHLTGTALISLCYAAHRFRLSSLKFPFVGLGSFVCLFFIVHHWHQSPASLKIWTRNERVKHGPLNKKLRIAGSEVHCLIPYHVSEPWTGKTARQFRNQLLPKWFGLLVPPQQAEGDGHNHWPAGLQYSQVWPGKKALNGNMSCIQRATSMRLRHQPTFLNRFLSTSYPTIHLYCIALKLNYTCISPVMHQHSLQDLSRKSTGMFFSSILHSCYVSGCGAVDSTLIWWVLFQKDQKDGYFSPPAELFHPSLASSCLQLHQPAHDWMTRWSD